MTVFCYAFSGFCAAAGSVSYSARLNMGRPTLGEDLTMDIVGGGCPRRYQPPGRKRKSDLDSVWRIILYDFV